MNRTVAIIGNGIAGVTAARFIRKYSDHRIVLISKESDHFYSRTALMYIYMGQMTFEQTKPYEDWFWQKNRISLRRATVEEIRTESKTLLLSTGETIEWDVLLLATGSTSRVAPWPGAKLNGVQGLYGLQDLAQLERVSKSMTQPVIVGGGLIGVELAEMLRSRHYPLTFLIREPDYWRNVLPAEESAMISREIRRHGVDLRTDQNVTEFVGESNHVTGVVTGSGERIEADFVGVTIGVVPNIDLARRAGIDVEQGILVDDHLRTSVDDVYAAGDCVQFRNPMPGHPPVEQLWYTGRMHGEAVAATIAGNPTRYRRGVWFNSAKFFDIEYQTYGFVAANPRSFESSWWWQDDEGRRGFRVNFNSRSGAVIGVNAFGIRYRQEVMERWMLEGRDVEYLIEHLDEANFDTELTRRPEAEIRDSFSSSHFRASSA